MADRSKQWSKTRKALVASGIVFLVFLVLFCVRYRSYIYAISWHCVHRSDVDIVGHKIRLSRLWWKENATDYDSYLLRRASSSSAFPEPVIVVRPALPGTIKQSDQDLLDSLQKLINARQKHPLAGVHSSLVVIKTQREPLYCEKTESRLLGIDLDSHLSCQGPTLTHTFTYDGVPIYEYEAESILASFQ